MLIFVFRYSSLNKKLASEGAVSVPSKPFPKGSGSGKKTNPFSEFTVTPST